MIYAIARLNILGMLSILIEKKERSLRLVGVVRLRLGERYHRSSILNRQYSIQALPGWGLIRDPIMKVERLTTKPAVAHYGSELSSIFLANFENATIDKTLFYEICIFD